MPLLQPRCAARNALEWSVVIPFRWAPFREVIMWTTDAGNSASKSASVVNMITSQWLTNGLMVSLFPKHVRNKQPDVSGEIFSPGKVNSGAVPGYQAAHFMVYSARNISNRRTRFTSWWTMVVGLLVVIGYYLPVFTYYSLVGGFNPPEKY